MNKRNTITKKYISLLIVITLVLPLFGCNQLKKTEKQVKNYISKINLDSFRKGWNAVAGYVSTTYSNIITEEWIENITNEIDKLTNTINTKYHNDSSVQSRAGYIAEDWVAGTFNIDAAINNSEYRAEKPNSNEIASPDVNIYKDDEIIEQIQLKYYSTPEGSVNASSKSWISKRNEYETTSDSYKDFLKNNHLTGEAKELLSSVYSGMTRIIPSDQVADAKLYLKGKITKLQLSNKLYASERADSIIETLDKIKDRYEAPDGTKSKTLTQDEATAISQLAVDGEFDPSDFGLTLPDLVTPKVLVKQAINTGEKTALFKTAITIGPEIFSAVCQAIDGNDISKEEIKKIGIDGLLSGTEGFVEGSVSAALTIACKAGKFGESFVNVSPNVIGALTVLTIDAIKYGYSLSTGEITPNDYGNLIAQEIVVLAASGITGAMFSALAPTLPIVYMAGSMVGGIIATIGFEAGKELLFEIQDGGGFEAVIPIGITNTIECYKEKIENLNLEEKIHGYKESIVSTINNGIIKLKIQ